MHLAKTNGNEMTILSGPDLAKEDMEKIAKTAAEAGKLTRAAGRKAEEAGRLAEEGASAKAIGKRHAGRTG